MILRISSFVMGLNLSEAKTICKKWWDETAWNCDKITNKLTSKRPCLCKPDTCISPKLLELAHELPAMSSISPSEEATGIQPLASIELLQILIWVADSIHIWLCLVMPFPSWGSVLWELAKVLPCFFPDSLLVCHTHPCSVLALKSPWSSTQPLQQFEQHMALC